MYTDEGITGTSTKQREGFKKMVRDALGGSIDLIITKSVSRFARNTVDSLTTIRKLKAAGVECYFEKENIWTFDGKGDVLPSEMIQCNDRGEGLKPLNMGFGKMAAYGQSFVLPENQRWQGGGGAYSLNDEYPFNDCLGYR